MPLNPEKKKKISGLSVDLDQLEEIVERLMKELAPELPRNSEKPVVFGFSMSIGSNGEPLFERLGETAKKIDSNAGAHLQPEDSKPEPLVDIQSGEKTVLLTAELHGVQKNDIRVKAIDSKTAELLVAGKNPFCRRFSLPALIKTSAPKTSFNNCVLEAVFERQ